jgi:hypothetical protein
LDQEFARLVKLVKAAPLLPLYLQVVLPQESTKMKLDRLLARNALLDSVVHLQQLNLWLVKKVLILY